MAIPNTPTHFYVQQGNGQVFLSWDLSTTGATNYPIQRSVDGVNFTSLADPTLNQYLDTTVTVGSQYYYQVAANNISGTSLYTAAQLVVPTLTAEMTLGQIRLQAQQRADRVNSNFVTLPEWNTYINQSYFELYDLLVTTYEDYYMASPYTLVTTSRTQYPLPDGLTVIDAINHEVAAPFYKLMGVDLGLDANSNAWVTLKKFEFIGRNRYVFPQITSTYLGVFNLRYRLVGNTLYFIPTPSANQYIRTWYIPRLNQLLQDTDTADGISGWTEYIIVDAAIKALQKEESDVTILGMQKMALIKRIEETAMNRDAGQPDSISDLKTRAERWGAYGPPNGDGGYGGY